MMTDGDIEAYERLEADGDLDHRNACDLLAEVKRLRAEVERMEALFQRTHHVHWSWVAKAIEAETRADEREACAAIAHRVAIVVPADAHPAGAAQQIEAEIRARGC